MSIHEEHVRQQAPAEILEAVGSRKVRQIAKRKDRFADALFDIIYADRTDWTVHEWNQALAEVDRSMLSVREWLQQREKDNEL